MPWRVPELSTHPKKFIRAVQSGHVVAVGDVASWSVLNNTGMKISLPTPSNTHTMHNAMAMISAVIASPHVVMAQLRGSMLLPYGLRTGKNENLLMKHIVQELNRLTPKQRRSSRLVCLNLGEFTQVEPRVLSSLNTALEQGHIGHIYYEAFANTYDIKKETQAIIKTNRQKTRYAEIMMDRRNPMRYLGCKAWFNHKKTYTVTIGRMAEALDHPSTREKGKRGSGCKRRCGTKRCRGSSRSGLRCCLCTNHESAYCHHHRREDR
jgi:hypothetical protein